ncbi:MAG TPA: molybdate ABC transporter substrate-binding protein [Burkholderiaceae bacterium]
MSRNRRWLLMAMAGLLGAAAASAPARAADDAPVVLYAAGSLREALTAIATAHASATGSRTVSEFGPSGVLRQRIESGAPAQVFASADTEHPQKLARAGGWGAPVVFVRNRLCVLATPAVQIPADGLLALLLQPTLRLATSTPGADPSGDYAWELFRRAEVLRPGAGATLSGKALQLTGASDSPRPPAGRSAYAWHLEQGRADVFLTYCTNAVAAQRELPALQVFDIPPDLQVTAAYALTVRDGAPAAAQALADALRAPAAQAVFQRLGFTLP